MKNNLFLSAILLFTLPMIGFGQIIFNEEFENGIPSTWTVLQTNPNQTWTTVQGTDFWVTNIATVGYDELEQPVDEMLITPSFDLTAAANPQLSFVMATSYFWAVTINTSDFYIKISADGGTTWEEIWNEQESMIFDANYIPIKYNIDLTEYAGEPNVKLAFHYVGISGAPTINMDHIEVVSEVDYCGYYFPENRVSPITLVSFAGIDNATPAETDGLNPHEFFLDQIGSVMPGETYPIKVKGVAEPSANFSLFIDWNQNNEFEFEEETYILGQISNSTGTDDVELVFNVTVPENAVLGNTRMRVVKAFNAVYSPCDSHPFESGQAEDYILKIEEEMGMIENLNAESSYYPNPVENILNIQAGENITDLMVYDLTGKQVFMEKLNFKSGAVNLSQLNSGVYVVKMIVKGEIKTFKIIKK